MTYIIENANILKENELVTTSFLVKENHIAYMSSHFHKYSFMKMNGEPYIMTPTYVIFDPLIDLPVSFQEKRDYFLNQFIQKGCTTLLTIVEVKYESELQSKLKSRKVELLNSPIDYVIGVKIPLRTISSSFVRKCKREKIPAIFIEIKESDDLTSVPWGWVREAMFPYNSPLIPIFSDNDLHNNKRLLLEWNRILDEHKINHISSTLDEKVPLQMNVLSKIGIFPLKSSLIQGAEVSYNLYKRNREIKNIDVMSLFHYHNDRLLITVHKGVVIRAEGNESLFRSGFGEYVLINTPSYFSIS
ncbi:hypothetical protein ACFSO7_17970 [Bacillus sp. CGMCC 1.16607]|uniref:hypothetical protein n=1 Tax=Bacillus sp. CGMCC 1.16607 TaxID=3351842 RepID=UPI0036349386